MAQDETETGGRDRGGIAPVSPCMLLEHTAHARAQDTWQARMEQALSGLHCQVMHATSAEAPGLLASGAQHLGAHPAPDLFHGQPALSQAVAAPMAVTQRAAHKAVTQAEEALTRRPEPLDPVTEAPPKRGPGRPPQGAASVEQGEQDVDAARQAHPRLTAQREQVTQRLTPSATRTTVSTWSAAYAATAR